MLLAPSAAPALRSSKHECSDLVSTKTRILDSSKVPVLEFLFKSKFCSPYLLF